MPVVCLHGRVNLLLGNSSTVEKGCADCVDIGEVAMCSYMLFFSWASFFGFVTGSGHHDFYGRRYDHYHGKYSDSELMVDVINNFGLRILMAHNEHNENNIAFSPYGIGVILMALGEGLQGEALYEIRKALYLPYDAHTIRVGLRDIHRHLKSYFIPKEGFLAGITLNIENVSINPEYIQLLKFYGYDINSFNTALYLENHVTTTESGVMGGREETTLTTDNVFVSSTSNPETTTEGEEDRKTTTDVEVVASTTMESVPPTSTKEPDQSTENQDSTTESSSDTTLQTSTTNSPSTATTTRITTTETVEEVTTEGNSDDIETTTVDAMERESTTNFQTTVSATSEVVYTSDTTTVATEVTTEEGLDGDVTLSVTDTQSSVTEVSSSSEAELFTSVTNSASSTTDNQMETTMSTISTENTETTTSNIRSVRSSAEYFTQAEDTNVIQEEVEEDNSKLESKSFDNKSDKEMKNKTEEFGADDWSIRINNKIILLNPNEDPPLAKNTVETIINKERRNPRSIEEYVITRFYHHHDFRPTKPYEPDQPLYFFLDEGTKEAGLDFMTYDTVLPFLYIPNPSAMALAFPLDSDRYYLLLLMPTETYRLDDLICKLYMHNTFKYILNNLELTHVRVNIPSFSLNGRITLTNTLQKLGIRRIFEPRQADFSPMTSTRDVYVTNIEQAVSVTIKNNLNIKKDTRHGHRYYSEPLRFDVNRPFLYFVIDSELQIILMTGKVLNPLNVRIK